MDGAATAPTWKAVDRGAEEELETPCDGSVGRASSSRDRRWGWAEASTVDRRVVIARRAWTRAAEETLRGAMRDRDARRSTVVVDADVIDVGCNISMTDRVATRACRGWDERRGGSWSVYRRYSEGRRRSKSGTRGTPSVLVGVNGDPLAKFVSFSGKGRDPCSGCKFAPPRRISRQAN